MILITRVDVYEMLLTLRRISAAPRWTSARMSSRQAEVSFASFTKEPKTKS